jgi:hypothetical protein
MFVCTVRTSAGSPLVVLSRPIEARVPDKLRASVEAGKTEILPSPGLGGIPGLGYRLRLPASYSLRIP